MYMVKKTVYFYTFIAVVLIFTNFGVLGASFINHGAHESCPFSAVSNNNCEGITSGSLSALHHITSIRSLGEGLLAPGISMLLVLLLVVVFVFTGRVYTQQKNYDERRQMLGTLNRSVGFIPSHILMWIALHNKRGAHIILNGAIA